MQFRYHVLFLLNCIRVFPILDVPYFKKDVYISFCAFILVIHTFYFQLITQERRLSTSASRTMAAMSLGFIVLVTPWTIQEVVVACTGTRAPQGLDFLVTWLALSNSFWNPFLYWLLNNQFRRISREILFSRVRPVLFFIF